MSVFQDLEAKITDAHDQIITVTRKLDELSDVEISLGRASKGLSASAESNLQLTTAQRELVAELRAATQAVSEAGSALRKADPERLVERLSNLTSEVQSLRSDLANEALAREQLGDSLKSTLQQQALQLTSHLREETSKIADAIERSADASRLDIETVIKQQSERTADQVVQLRNLQDELFKGHAASLAALAGRTSLLIGISLLILGATLGLGAYNVFLSP